MQSKHLRYKQSLTLFPTPPFNFDGTFHKPSHFPDHLSLWKKRIYWQSFRVDRQLYGLKICNQGTIEKPELEALIFADHIIGREEFFLLKNEITWRFDLKADLKEFFELGRKNERFFPIFKKWRGMRDSCGQTLYELLIISVLLQNATVKRTVQMIETLLSQFGTQLKFDNCELAAIWLADDMQKVSEQQLRELKIGYRAKFIKKLSADFVAGKVDENQLRTQSQEEAKKMLVKLYGVGPETARILLFESLHHYDTFDHIAPWQQKIYARLFYKQSSVSADKIRADIQKQYGKYSMLAVHYIWEDIFWKRKHEHIAWLEKEIRL